MAKLPSKNPRIGNEVKAAPAAPARTTTPVRNSAIPKLGAARTQISHEMIAKRAYEISISGQGGSEVDNWLRAERELKGE